MGDQEKAIKELNLDVLDFAGRNLKELSVEETFHFCKANKGYGEPGISYGELSVLHQACELCGHRFLRIIETGMCYGTTTRYFLIRNLKYRGELHTFEINIREKFKYDMCKLGLWCFIDRHGHSIKSEIKDQPIDFLFIDSEHALQDALGEYMRFRMYLTAEAIIGFHDTECCPGVKKAIEMIQEVDELELVAKWDNKADAGIRFYRRILANRSDRNWNTKRRI